MVDSGSAWVFRRDAGAWVAEAQLRAANGTAGDFFGTSVALAEPVDTAGAADAGRVWAWSIDATGTALPAWSLTAPAAGTGDAFGHAIALDSATLAVGAYATDGAAPNQGALHLYAIAPAPCAGDLDGNGDTGASDLAAMLNAWGACGY